MGETAERIHVTRSRANPGGAKIAEGRPFRERKPPWLKVPAPGGPTYRRLKQTIEALFPSPQDITLPNKQIVRVATAEVIRKLNEGKRLLLVHGEGGCGKTTLTQQLASGLPPGSAVVTYDCYGAGRYMYSDDRRHLPERAFLQIINDLALAAELPILIPRSRTHPVTTEVLFKRLRFCR